MLFVPAVLAIGAARAQTYTESVLYSFAGTADGAHPYASLVRDPQGELYGTTIQGGAFSYGTVFKLDKEGNETTLYTFPANGGEAALPTGLTRDKRGNLYGTTYGGGAYSQGSVFKLDASGNQIVLYSFTGADDGAEPQAGLLLDAEGNLYGTTEHGGNLSSCYGSGCGTVFKLDTTGHETVLYTFTGTAGDGYWPMADLLVRDVQGNLYGTTSEGGAFNYGMVFKVDATGKETVLHSFTMIDGDGAYPQAALVRDARGNLYGTTIWGGAFGYGMVFKLDRTGRETVLHSFGGTSGDGIQPDAGLLRDAHGNLYGTTGAGGAFSSGTVFTLDTKGNESVVYSFRGTGGDGQYPAAGLVRNARGDLYGTTVGGGAYGYGTIFKLTP
jgi:uncharacterized repeat protein (TIGR03803 family)